MALRDYVRVIFQIGPNLTCEVQATEKNPLWGGYTGFHIDNSLGIGGITGSGDMYSDSSMFISIGGYTENEVYIQDNTMSWDDVLFSQFAPWDYWISQWDVVIPSGVTSVASNFMKGCSIKNQGLSLPSSLISIGDNAFKSSGFGDTRGGGYRPGLITKSMALEVLDLPVNLQHLGEEAFGDQHNLQHIRFQNIDYEMEIYNYTTTGVGNIFFLQNDSGTNTDEDGHQYTEVVGGIGVKAYDWIKLFHRHAIFSVEAAWYCAYNSNGGILEVPLYRDGEIGVCYLDNGMKLYNKIRSTQSPIRICTKNVKDSQGHVTSATIENIECNKKS